MSRLIYTIHAGMLLLFVEKGGSAYAMMDQEIEKNPLNREYFVPKEGVKYIVRMTEEEREYLIELTKTGKVAARKITHARILLRTDISKEKENLKDESIKDLEHISSKTVSRIRQLFVEEGLEAALN